MTYKVSQRREMEYPYYWRVRTRYAERFGHSCKVIARGRMNSCLVEFEDGHRTITSRNYVRRRNGGAGGDQDMRVMKFIMRLIRRIRERMIAEEYKVRREGLKTLT